MPYNHLEFIKKLLPYGEEFCFVDAFTELTEEKAAGNYTFREDAWFFPSHFPEDDYQHYIDTFKAFKKVSIVVTEEYWKTKELEKDFTASK